MATEFDPTRWREPTSLAIILLSCGRILALLGAAYYVIMVEWLFVHHEPPSLAEFLDAEDRIRAKRSDIVEAQMLDLLTGSYAIAYQQYLCGNIVSSRSRTRPLRLVLVSLILLAVAFLLLPLHRIG